MDWPSFLCGDYRKGLAGFEWRWEIKGSLSAPPKISAPKWQGEDIAGRSILVFFEQGLGDQIQFARYLPLLIQRGAKVTFFCRANLVRLFGPLCAEIEVVTSLVGQEPFDFQCALMSLPLRLGTDLGSVPSRISYLKPEAGLVDSWKQHIGEVGFKIGIAWQGNPDRKIDGGRSLPLSEFIPLTRRPGIRLISLQKTQGLDQLTKLAASTMVETLGDQFDGGPDAFIDTAAVMSNLDLIVTSDTSIAHLAAHWAARPGLRSNTFLIGVGCSIGTTALGIRPCACSANRPAATGAACSGTWLSNWMLFSPGTSTRMTRLRRRSLDGRFRR